MGVSPELTSRPLLVRLLKMVAEAVSGITAQQAANSMGRQLSSVYVALSRLRELGLIDEGTSADRRETIFLIADQTKKARALQIIESTKTAKFSTRLANFVLSEWQERIARQLDKALQECRVERSRRGLPDIVIKCGNALHGVEVKVGHGWQRRQDRTYGELMRTVESRQFRSFYLVILGKTQPTDRVDQMSEMLQRFTDFHVIRVEQIDLYRSQPDEESWNEVLHKQIVKRIVTYLAKSHRTGTKR